MPRLRHDISTVNPAWYNIHVGNLIIKKVLGFIQLDFHGTTVWARARHYDIETYKISLQPTNQGLNHHS